MTLGTDTIEFAIEEALARPVPDMHDDGREVWQDEYFQIRNALVVLRELVAEGKLRTN